MAKKLEHDTNDGMSGYYRGNEGSFRIHTDPELRSCRETFHNRIDARRVDHPDSPYAFYYFLKNYQNLDTIFETFHEIEDRLELQDGITLGLLSKTNPGIVYIEPGPFWSDPVRFNLLTCILRDTRGSVQSLKSNGVFMPNTEMAFQYFLEGNTFYQLDAFKGWHNAFGGVSQENIAKALAKAPGNVKSVLVTHNSSWQPRTWPLAQA